ncbi:MAG: 3-hydroxybutyryl-CoA dehydrogenase [Bacteroidia bacterium]|nr:3-hydroxybutyryl-CoA dehydrogenase [Bacteroidia bacterium]
MIVGIIGSGAMGAGIAQVAATNNCTVLVYDSNAEALSKAEQKLKTDLSKLVVKAKLTQAEAEAIITNTTYATALAQFAQCDLVIEAIVENLEVKKQVFTTLETIVSSQCILASNTSSIAITSIAAACANAERVVGIHFFNPATIMPLVEIIPALQTNNDITLKSKTIIDSWGKTTVVAKDTPGFIVNRIARPYYGEAIRIYEEGIADFATIDWAMREYGGFKMGPFELMDFIGNDVNYKVTETVWQQFFYEPRFKPSFTQKNLFDAQYFGRKTGRGYYNYAPNVVQPEPDKNEMLAKDIFTRILCMLINEAVDALYLKIAAPADIDNAMQKGVNYPKGLLHWCNQIGAHVVLAHMNELYNTYQEDRYRPSILLKRLAQNGELIDLI